MLVSADRLVEQDKATSSTFSLQSEDPLTKEHNNSEGGEFVHSTSLMMTFLGVALLSGAILWTVHTLHEIELPVKVLQNKQDAR